MAGLTNTARAPYSPAKRFHCGVCMTNSLCPHTNPSRRLLIEQGLLVPAEERSERSAQGLQLVRKDNQSQPGDPTPADWIDLPTLRLDVLADKAMCAAARREALKERELNRGWD